MLIIDEVDVFLYLIEFMLYYVVVKVVKYVVLKIYLIVILNELLKKDVE